MGIIALPKAMLEPICVAISGTRAATTSVTHLLLLPNRGWKTPLSHALMP